MPQLKLTQAPSLILKKRDFCESEFNSFYFFEIRGKGKIELGINH